MESFLQVNKYNISKTCILIGLKLCHSRKYTPVFPAANSYGKMVANIDVKSNGTSSFMRTHTDTGKYNGHDILDQYTDLISKSQH